MFLVLCNEAFGYSHERTLNSSLALLLSMLREHGYLVNERNRSMYPDDGDGPDDPGEWAETIDFETGLRKRVRKMKS